MIGWTAQSQAEGADQFVKWFPVSGKVNSSANDGLELIQPIDLSAAATQSLARSGSIGREPLPPLSAATTPPSTVGTGLSSQGAVAPSNAGDLMAHLKVMNRALCFYSHAVN